MCLSPEESQKMRIAVIGAGGIGSALAALFSRHGHSVVLGSRHPERLTGLLREIAGATATTVQNAAQEADVVCICVPWEHLSETLDRLGDLSGKLVMDVSNPETTDGRSLAVGHSRSGAEIIAGRAEGARVVKAFNYLYAELLRDPQALLDVCPSIFFCGDDDAARATVSELILSCGLEPIDCGPLQNARYLEPLALLMVQLVRERGWPPARVGMRFVHPRGTD